MIANNPSRVYISRLTNKEVPLLLKAISKNFNKKNGKFKKNFDKSYWYWQYKQNTTKRSFIYIAWFKKKINCLTRITSDSYAS